MQSLLWISNIIWWEMRETIAIWPRKFQVKMVSQDTLCVNKPGLKPVQKTTISELRQLMLRIPVPITPGSGAFLLNSNSNGQLRSPSPRTKRRLMRRPKRRLGTCSLPQLSPPLQLTWSLKSERPSQVSQRRLLHIYLNLHKFIQNCLFIYNLLTLFFKMVPFSMHLLMLTNYLFFTNSIFIFKKELPTTIFSLTLYVLCSLFIFDFGTDFGWKLTFKRAQTCR